jgi:hypothetical protein
MQDTTADVDTDAYTHVYPTFGRVHVLIGFTCWCRPAMDPECATLVIHNEDN